MSECKHGKTIPGKLIEKLPDNQGGPGRHKCVTCAYEAGVRTGKLQMLAAITKRLKIELKYVREEVDNVGS